MILPTRSTSFGVSRFWEKSIILRIRNSNGKGGTSPNDDENVDQKNKQSESFYSSNQYKRFFRNLRNMNHGLTGVNLLSVCNIRFGDLGVLDVPIHASSGNILHLQPGTRSEIPKTPPAESVSAGNHVHLLGEEFWGSICFGTLQEHTPKKTKRLQPIHHMEGLSRHQKHSKAINSPTWPTQPNQRPCPSPFASILFVKKITACAYILPSPAKNTSFSGAFAVSTAVD